MSSSTASSSLASYSLASLGEQALHELGNVFKQIKDDAADALIDAIIAALKARGISVECPPQTQEKFDPNSLNRLVD